MIIWGTAWDTELLSRNTFSLADHTVQAQWIWILAVPALFPGYRSATLLDELNLNS
jgi:hypothetical protein